MLPTPMERPPPKRKKNISLLKSSFRRMQCVKVNLKKGNKKEIKSLWNIWKKKKINLKKTKQKAKSEKTAKLLTKHFFLNKNVFQSFIPQFCVVFFYQTGVVLAIIMEQNSIHIIKCHWSMQQTGVKLVYNNFCVLKQWHQNRQSLCMEIGVSLFFSVLAATTVLEEAIAFASRYVMLGFCVFVTPPMLGLVPNKCYQQQKQGVIQTWRLTVRILGRAISFREQLFLFAKYHTW